MHDQEELLYIITRLVQMLRKSKFGIIYYDFLMFVWNVFFNCLVSVIVIVGLWLFRLLLCFTSLWVSSLENYYFNKNRNQLNTWKLISCSYLTPLVKLLSTCCYSGFGQFKKWFKLSHNSLRNLNSYSIS